MKKKSPESIPNTIMSSAMFFFFFFFFFCGGWGGGTQERVRNSRGKRAISVRATEVLLNIYDG